MQGAWQLLTKLPGFLTKHVQSQSAGEEATLLLFSSTAALKEERLRLSDCGEHGAGWESVHGEHHLSLQTGKLRPRVAITCLGSEITCGQTQAENQLPSGLPACHSP